MNVEWLVDFHLDSDRQGPGSEASTLRALSLIPIDNAPPLQIADIGCGSGASTILLAQHTNAHITAVDLFPAFLDKLNSQAQTLGLEDRITTLEASMDALPFDASTFDIIWSEGAIYNMGFLKGLQYWQHFLQPGGYMAISEITWLTDERPQEIDKHWQQEYPEIGTVADKCQAISKAGLQEVGHFILPSSDWLDNYYVPMEKRMASFLDRHQHSTDAQAVVAEERKEIALYTTYQDYLSYGFYVMQKP